MCAPRSVMVWSGTPKSVYQKLLTSCAISKPDIATRQCTKRLSLLRRSTINKKEFDAAILSVVGSLTKLDDHIHGDAAKLVLGHRKWLEGEVAPAPCISSCYPLRLLCFVGGACGERKFLAACLAILWAAPLRQRLTLGPPACRLPLSCHIFRSSWESQKIKLLFCSVLFSAFRLRGSPADLPVHNA
jgi:hypothetical protein